MGPLAIGALAQLPSILGGLFAGAKQKKLAKKIQLMDPTYKESPYAKDQLAYAQNAMNARMRGATQAEQNILTGQANQFANLQRNATDSSQLLALAAGVGGNTNQSLINLGMAEGDNALQRQGMYNQALQVMTNEGDKVYNDKLRKYQEAVAAKNQLMQSGMVNQQNAFNQIGNFGALAAGGLFGGGMGGRQANGAAAQNGYTAADYGITTGAPNSNRLLSLFMNRGTVRPTIRF